MLGCWKPAALKRMQTRLSKIIGLPRRNFFDLQVSSGYNVLAAVYTEHAHERDDCSRAVATMKYNREQSSSVVQ
jgi:hypothetical protein